MVEWRLTVRTDEDVWGADVALSPAGRVEAGGGSIPREEARMPSATTVKKKAKRKFTPKGKAKGDPRRRGGKWPGALGISIKDAALFSRFERARAAVAKREKLPVLSRSTAITRAIDLWLRKVGG